MTFEQLGLRPELTEAVAAKGYLTPSPIQAQAIPAILAGHDVLGGAQTGTGKTAAFALPLLQRLAATNVVAKRPRALVLAPTRELAAQVHQSIVDYGRRLEIRSTVIFGGVGFGAQITALRRGLDIIVATPGRLLDLCQQREANLSNVEVLILDEADRMLDMGFIHDIRKIIAMLPAKRQNLFFSATYAKDVKKLADTILRDPVEVEVAPRNSTADRVDQEAYEVGQKSKHELLSTMIKTGDWSQVLVFTRTKHGANRLATQLEKDGIPAMAIHGNKSQSARERALAAFKANDVLALVATDIAARGLDIADLPYVVNYELPNVPEDYVHRIGRTGRAGKAGKAISLVAEAEVEYLWEIEKLLKRGIPRFSMDKNGEKTSVEPRDLPRGGHSSPPNRRGPQPSRGGSRPPRDAKHSHETKPTRSAVAAPPSSNPRPAPTSGHHAPAPSSATTTGAGPARRRNRWNNRRTS